MNNRKKTRKKSDLIGIHDITGSHIKASLFACMLYTVYS